ncbi:MAG: DUF4340 domain-containing protein [Lentisphaerae bacterium]|nr:DUF4340 domain-containing protein [Lentisphaerota bacterium]
MKTSNLVVLGTAAAALIVAAVATSGSGRSRQPQLNGKRIVGDFAVADAAKVDIGGKVVLSSGEGGWKIDTMQDYPADTSKISENLMKLQELKVGQVVRGKELAEKTPVKVTDASGKPLAEVTLGERHEKWGMGRYAEFSGAAVLVSDTLDAFGDDPKSWCDTKIVDEPRISFTKLAAPDLADDVTGFATGVVAKVKIGDDTNRVATVGAKVKDGSGRYLKVDGMKWIFEVPDYSVSSLLPKPEEPKSEEPKAEDAKPEEPKAEEPKPEL